MSAPLSHSYGWHSTEATPAHDYLWPAIERLLPPKEHNVRPRVLDLGCGNGYIASRLYALDMLVTGVDASSDGITLAKRAYPGIRFETASVYDDLTDLLGQGEFDLVISSEVIEHLFFPRKLLQNAFALLRPGGNAILTTVYHGYLKNLALSVLNKWDDHHTVHWDGGHVKFFSKRTLRSMLEEAGFSRVRFANAGRAPWLWKSMVCRAERQAVE